MRRLITLLFAVLLGIGWIVPVSAQSPLQQATGFGAFTQLEIVSSEFAGPNRIEVRRITGQVFGDLTGIWSQEVRGVVHPNGEVTFHGTWEFSGQVGTCGVGTISGQLTGRGTAGQPPDFPQTIAQATSTGTQPGTIAIVGQGVITQQGFFVFYDIQYQCK
jgi:hypothetical protein